MRSATSRPGFQDGCTSFLSLVRSLLLSVRSPCYFFPIYHRRQSFCPRERGLLPWIASQSIDRGSRTITSNGTRCGKLPETPRHGYCLSWLLGRRFLILLLPAYVYSSLHYLQQVVPYANCRQFTSIVVGSFGFDTLGTQYLQIPGGAVQFLSLLAGGFIATKFGERFHARSICMIVANSICIIGAGLLVGLPDSNKWGRLVALWLCYFQGLGFSMSLTIVSSNIAGYTKKQVTGALLFTGYCVGNIIGPQTFKSSEAPRYHSAYIASVIPSCRPCMPVANSVIECWLAMLSS